MTLQLIKDYKQISKYRLSFNQLAGRVFGIDFEKWYRLGFWNDRYVCYSVTDGDRVVANVSASRLDIIWLGNRSSAVQIGTVMTEPEYRHQGLATKLMHWVLDEYADSCDLIYLFSNKKALSFYQQFGCFIPVTESRFSAAVSSNPNYSGIIRKLNLSNAADMKILARMAQARIPISRIFDVDRAHSILAWHCLFGFAEDLYYLEDIEQMVIYKVENGILHLYDVIGSSKPELTPVLNRVATPDVQKVVFYFTPDFADFRPESHPFEPEDYTFLIKSATLHCNGKFFYPATAHA